ncbi:PD-(D/E)XK nuclease superfamily protein [Flexibacter flexilis DSM 6793]|uniref:PD-(D/E)XK nuclease superfamily protein n=1 Tax=Flexibacter flexilis DSM 6793 TaxID=927664 RepID=A0A1I1GFQ4_9BACT|nr:PD-(D/E)XK nuclease family protein [Flexibacter flexilis]SFC08000.1 PD-(D/E)XK nuclease superfamily protein [Flexibacter flexilis DSM 6793]
MMQTPFLKQLAQSLLAKHGNQLSDICLVFPNNRAGVFFRRFLSESTDKPVWSPVILSIGDLVARHSAYIKPDKLTLAFDLFEAYNTLFKKKFGQEQTFEKFYFWGEMLLKDFDEIDKNLIDAARLFEDLSEQKELDFTFEDFLDEDQKHLIQSFWSSFQADQRGSDFREQFLQMWRMLPEVYELFKQKLVEKGRAYEGMMFRELSEKMQNTDFTPLWSNVIFAGFSVLTRSELNLIEAFVKRGGDAFWDVDAHYVSSSRQEAGMPFRKIAKNPILKNTLPDPLPNHFQPETESKQIELIGVPLQAAQGKVVGELLSQLPAPDLRLNTLVVLPSQSLLFPMLHALPQNIARINVTLGYPIRSTPVYSLFLHLRSLHKTAKISANGNAAFFYKPVLDLLRHPFILYYNNMKAVANIRDIEESNRIYTSLFRLKEQDDFYSLLFRPIADTDALFEYLLTLFPMLATSMRGSLNEDSHTMEEEYLFVAYTQIQAFRNLLTERKITIPLENAWVLLKKMIESLSIPFRGEPLEGLQVMGLLESQTLDFENIIIPAMNEGQLPPTPPQGSFIPINIRRAYGLHSPEEHDAQYAYYFYRLLHKAKRIYLIHNTESTADLKSEISRLAYQVQFELGYPVTIRTASAQAMPLAPTPISIPKTGEVKALLENFLTKNNQEKRRLTPSGINMYLNCSLQFYFAQIAQLQEPETVSESIDAATFGNLLHETMQYLYVRLRAKKKNRDVEAQDFETLFSWIPEIFAEVFRKEFDIPQKEEIIWEGKNLIIRNVIYKYVRQILKIDSTYAPFEILGLESGKDYLHDFPLTVDGQPQAVQLKGIIDRIDRKGNLVRVLDYKTGKEEMYFSEMEELFKSGVPKKAIMQTFFYGLLYYETQPEARDAETVLNVGLVLTRDLFDKEYSAENSYKFEMGAKAPRQRLSEISHLLPEFKQLLEGTLSEIFDDTQAFTQTDDLSRCVYCAYKSLCHR